MKRFFLILIGCLAAVSCLKAENPTNFPFQVGEKLTYQIYWGPFVGGRATLEVVNIEQVDGHDCFHIVAAAHTSGLADFLYHVENITESWLDTTALCTRRYKEDRVEGKHHHRIADCHYDYAASQLVTTNLVTGKVHIDPLKTPAEDLISSFYYLRTQTLQLDVEQQFSVNLFGTQYNVTVRPDERKSMFFRPLGDVQALRVEPNPTLSFVAANNGRMWFWVSDDKRKLPLLLVSDMKIGSAKLVLFDYKASASSTNDVHPMKPLP